MTPTTLIFPITPSLHQQITSNWERFRAQAREKGITLAPDGSFSGRATGSVTIERDRISVLITNKPFYVPIGAINSELKRLFS